MSSDSDVCGDILTIGIKLCNTFIVKIPKYIQPNTNKMNIFFCRNHKNVFGSVALMKVEIGERRLWLAVFKNEFSLNTTF